MTPLLSFENRVRGDSLFILLSFFPFLFLFFLGFFSFSFFLPFNPFFPRPDYNKKLCSSLKVQEIQKILRIEFYDNEEYSKANAWTDARIRTSKRSGFN